MILSVLILSACREREPAGVSLREYLDAKAPERVSDHWTWTQMRLKNIAFATIVQAGNFGLTIDYLVRPDGAQTLGLLVEDMGRHRRELCGRSAGCDAPIVAIPERPCLYCKTNTDLPEPKAAWLLALTTTRHMLTSELCARVVAPGDSL